MYEAYFRFSERPFAATPSPERYFPAASIEQAHKMLHRTIDRAEGAGMIVGPSGTGKTLLLQVLADEFRGRFSPVLLSSGRFATVRALLQGILFHLNRPYKQMDESELRLALIEYLAPSQMQDEGLLLLLDEAHAMSWRLLDEVRMITNLIHDGRPRVHVILAGSPKLEERFASPRLEAFAQRLAARCYLESFSRDETRAYLEWQINSAGGNAAKLFCDDAASVAHRATDGIPRLLNQVCDHALLLASLGGIRQISGKIVEEAWADLQQLPAPWNATTGARAQPAKVIEVQPAEAARVDSPHAIPFSITSAFSAPESSVVEFGSLELESAEVRLNALESHVQQLEEEFRPAGTIGPEVELVFRGGRSPFGNEFTEEEVVLDRYASLEADLFHQRPVVTSHEGRELAALLAPQTIAIAESVVKLPEEMPGWTASRHRAEPAEPTAARPASVAVSESAAEPVDDDDLDLIVVEDNPDVVARLAPPPLVRKQEYRQLFAKLRRG
jgi:type II secretory pathway predicted ATPase ExeA